MQGKNGGLAAWKARQREFRNSGMTRRAYCEKNGVKVSTLDYWFGRIRKAEQRQSLVEIQRAPLETKVAGASVIVAVGRFRIELPTVASVEILAPIVRALESLQ